MGLCLLWLFLGACSKDDDNSEPLDPVYQGTWRSEMDSNEDYTVINIGANGKGHFEEFGPSANENFSGDVFVANTAFTVGIKIYTLTQAATLESGTTCKTSNQGEICLVYSAKMELNNVPFFRVDEVQLK